MVVGGQISAWMLVVLWAPRGRMAGALPAPNAALAGAACHFSGL